MAKYLNYTGLQYFYNRLKETFVSDITYANNKLTKTKGTTSTDLLTVANGAEVNQNAFGAAQISNGSGSSQTFESFDASSKTDTLCFDAGNNVTLSTANQKHIVIAATDTVTTATTTGSGNAVTAITASNGALTVTKGSTFLLSNGTAASATKLATARYLDGVSFDGTGNIAHFAAYDNSSATMTVSCTGFNYENGARIHIYHVQSKAGGGTATLNVNSLGAKSVKFNGGTSIPLISAGTMVEYVYYDNAFHICGLDTNTTYTTMTQTQATAGSSSTGQLISAKVLSTTIANAVAGVTQISYEIVTTLPATGSAGVIYLVKDNTKNAYKEYIWITDKYELLGDTAIEIEAIANSEIDSLFA